MGKCREMQGNTQAKTPSKNTRSYKEGLSAVSYQWRLPLTSFIGGNLETAPTVALQAGYETAHLAQDRCKVYYC